MASLATGAQVLATHPLRAASGASASKANLHNAADEREPEAIELPVLGYLKHDSAASSGLAISSQNNVVSAFQAGGDIEEAPAYSQTVALPTSEGEGNADPPASPISAAQKAFQRRKRMINLGTLCFDVFLNGWNDATAGPLLPRVQAYYGVRLDSVLEFGTKLTVSVDWLRHCLLDFCVQHHREWNSLNISFSHRLTMFTRALSQARS